MCFFLKKGLFETHELTGYIDRLKQFNKIKFVKVFIYLKYLSKRKITEKMKIKYDGRTNKILRIATIFSALFTVAGWVCLFMEISGTEVIMVGGIYGGSVLFLFSGLQSLAGLCYVRRLKRHGYEVPYKREDYDNNLQNVPTHREHIRINEKSMESRILFVLYLCIFMAMNAWNVYYIISWYKYIDSVAMFWLRIMLVLDVCWMIGAIVFYRQRNVEKYRDDVEQDPNRKERVPVEKGVIICIVILVIVFTTKKVLWSASDYTFRSRVEHDKQYLWDIHSAIYMAVDSVGEGESYEQLLEGCYISDWTVPEDEFAVTIAESLGISDFAQLEDRIYCSDGKPVIYVKITDGEVCVRMENPLRPDHGIQYNYEVK